MISRIARRLGTKFVDAGIRADGLLARAWMCMGQSRQTLASRCEFGKQDYEAMGHSYSCTGQLRRRRARGQARRMGGLAAAVAAMECRKLLEDEGQPSHVGRQVVIEAACHHLYANVLRADKACRFDHQPLPIRKTPASTLGELAAATVAVEGKSWVTRLMCGGCGQETPVLLLQGRMRRSAGPLRPLRRAPRGDGIKHVPRWNWAQHGRGFWAGP